MVQASRDIQRVRSGQDKRAGSTFVRRTPSGASGYLLFLTGIGVAAFGFGLLQPPAVIPHADWIALKFSRLGFHGVPFLAAGMTIFCFGFVQRLQARIGRALAVTESSDTAPELSRLIEELGQVRGALGNVQTELLANKQRQDSMLESIQSVTARNKNSEGDSNAMFRLAASLDQLGARIEERLKHQGQSFESRLADVTTSVVRAQQEVTEAVDQVENSVSRVASEMEFVKQQEHQLASQLATLSQPTAATPTQPEPTSHTPTLGMTAEPMTLETETPEPTLAAPERAPEFTEDDLGFEEPQQQATSEEDLHVFVELEEDSQPEPTIQQDSPLGILDSLDDYGGIVEKPAAQDEGLRMAGEPESALPGQQPGQPQNQPGPQPFTPQKQNWPPTPQGE